MKKNTKNFATNIVDSKDYYLSKALDQIEILLRTIDKENGELKKQISCLLEEKQLNFGLSEKK
jgi:hypothetical protein